MNVNIPACVAVAGLLLTLSADTATAELRLPAVVSNGMVLQQDHANPLWGWAAPGEKVVATASGHTVTGKARQDGRWQVSLPPLAARSEPIEIRLRTSSGSERIIRDVLVGEVWFCTGPSNIFWPVKRCDNAQQEIAAAKYPEIRFFTVKLRLADEPQDDCVGNWFACSPQTVGDVSGIGYFFARRIHKEQGVPVGVLQSFLGGTRVEAWTSKEAFDSQPALRPILQWWEDAIASYDADQAMADYQRKLSRWKQVAADAESQSRKPPSRPPRPEDPRTSRHRPACLHNGMVAPLIPFGIRGVISYQGLGNLYWAEHSQVLLSTMIRDWRSRWGQGPFPFGMVQPAPFPCDRWPKQHEDAYSLQRESQLLVLDELANTGVAPTMDIGDLDELHFTNKQDVGKRLAHWALATVYGQDVPYAGPIYESMAIEGNKIRIRFKHTAKGLATSDGRAPTHFTIAGEDSVFHPAAAVIRGDTVLVHSKDVAKPTAVRFAWSDTAIPNLVNSDGLPASLFGTDVPTP